MKTIFLIICVMLTAINAVRAEEYIIFNNTVYFTNGINLYDLKNQSEILYVKNYYYANYSTRDPADWIYSIEDDVMLLMTNQPNKSVFLERVEYTAESSFWGHSTIGRYDLYGKINGKSITFEKKDFSKKKEEVSYGQQLLFFLASIVMLFLVIFIIDIFEHLHDKRH